MVEDIVRPQTHQLAIPRWAAIMLIAAGTQMLLTPPLRAAATKKEISDSGITEAVRVGLIFEKGVFPNPVAVGTNKGIVTLSGSVDNLLAKDRAVKIAETIRGVLGVIDRMTVTGVTRPDEDTRKDILAALHQDPATQSYPVSVMVHDGVATLNGSVGSYGEEQLASQIAQGVKGIKEVRNSITINYQTKRTDAEIAADVKSRLQWDVWVNGDMIDTDVKDGRVTLTGTTGSAIARSRALDDAWVNGVLSVNDSGLNIEPWERNDTHRRLKYGTRSDGEIKQALQTALRTDPRVSAFSPDVTVDEGAAILGGTVGTVKARTAAEQDANNTVGVWRVTNLLKVSPKGQPTDADAEKQLKATLNWDPLVDGFLVSASVINHVAYLSGTVDSSVEKAEAQDVASRINGIAVVRNHLKVEPEVSAGFYDWPYYGYSGSDYYGFPYYDRPPYLTSETFGPQPYLTDEEIKSSIERAFFWSPFVDSDDITVAVHGGVATLTGTVGTWLGYGEADRDAHKSGAVAVHDQLKVKKGAWL